MLSDRNRIILSWIITMLIFLTGYIYARTIPVADAHVRYSAIELTIASDAPLLVPPVTQPVAAQTIHKEIHSVSAQTASESGTAALNTAGTTFNASEADTAPASEGVKTSHQSGFDEKAVAAPPIGISLEDFITLLDSRIKSALVYPAKAVKRNIEGTVAVSLTVDTSGRLLSSSLAQSCGYNILDEAAQNLLISIFPIDAVLSEEFHTVLYVRYVLVP